MCLCVCVCVEEHLRRHARWKGGLQVQGEGEVYGERGQGLGGGVGAQRDRLVLLAQSQCLAQSLPFPVRRGKGSERESKCGGSPKRNLFIQPPARHLSPLSRCWRESRRRAGCSLSGMARPGHRCLARQTGHGGIGPTGRCRACPPAAAALHCDARTAGPRCRRPKSARSLAFEIQRSRGKPSSKAMLLPRGLGWVGLIFGRALSGPFGVKWRLMRRGSSPLRRRDRFGRQRCSCVERARDGARRK